MKFRLAAATCLLLGLVIPLGAQSNSLIDILMAQPNALYGETAYLTLMGGGWIGENATPEDAFAMAQEKGWIASDKTAADSPSLADLAFLAMQGLRANGGIGWMLFPSRRYAYKELVSHGIINTSGGESRIPSGEEVVRVIGRVAELPRRWK